MSRCSRCRCGERDCGSGGRHVDAMMLSEPVHIETDPVGQLDLRNDIAESFAVADNLAADGFRRSLGKARETEFKHGVSFGGVVRPVEPS